MSQTLLANEVLLETIYEEVISEIESETLANMYSEDDINSEVMRRFWDISN